ncbi:MAG TPA: Hsp70 family protein [Chloroflexota bacterium]|nr:Hsp70 family protein [Chloroflexota bacterium]
MKVGLDFGTSNSSVAVLDGQHVRLLPIENQGADNAVLRSVLYIGRDGGRSVGQRAIETYFDQNTGRSVRYALKFIRVIQMTFAETGTIEVPAYARIDENEPGRLFQSLKSFLRDLSFKGTSVFGQTYALEDLIAVLLAEIRRRTEEILGEEVEEWIVGRPVHYAERPDADALAIRRMAEACRRAGMARVRFEPEPIAAGRHYALQAERPATALVFDMGGGTLDLTVLKVGGTWEVLATDGVPVAGDVFDSRIVEGSVIEYFGLNAAMGAEGQPFPVHIPLTLTDWASIVGLNDPKTLDTIRVARRTSPQRSQLPRSNA